MRLQSSFKTISSGMAVNSMGILASRVSGLVRDIFFARFLGTSNALGAFLVAFTVPNLFRRIFGEGALSEAFVPLFTRKLSKNGRASAFQLAYEVLSGLTLILLGVVAFGMVICGVLSQYVPNSFAQLTLKLSTLLLPYTVFICISAICTGMLNSLKHYSVPAASPLILNCLLVLALIYICPRLGPNESDQLSGLVGAVLLAGILQLLSLILVLFRYRFIFQFSTNFRSPQMKELVSLVVPGIFGASITQINVLFDRFFASWLGGFAVTSLYYSERLVYLPIGVFGVALATACLPEFTRALAEDRVNDMIVAFFYSLRQILYLTLPFVLFLMMLAPHLVSLLYQRGNFDEESARGTVAAIMFYAPGIPAFAAVKILRAAFFCRKDTLTPARVGGYCLILNVILNIILIVPLKHCGLALATTISSYANVVLLSIIFYRSLEPKTLLPLKDLLASVVRVTLAILSVAIVIGSMQGASSDYGKLPIDEKFLQCFIPMTLGAALYTVLSLAMGSKEPREMYAVLASKIRNRT